MKPRNILITGSVLFLSLAAFAQDDDKNLVKNPGFETMDGRLKKQKQIEVAKHWVSPTAAKADLYSGSVKEIVSTPENAQGREEAFEGENYAGIRIYSYNDKQPRTYLMTELLGPLKKGMKYCVSFQVSLSDISKYAVNTIGAHMSKKPLESEEKISLILDDDDVHVRHSKKKVFNAQYGWHPICTVYEAKGGEKWITIGNFATNKVTEQKDEKMKAPKDLKLKQTYDAYYFIDDVQVFFLDSIEECQCEKENIGVDDIETIYRKVIISNKELKTPELVEASTLYFATSKPDLTTDAQTELDILAERMKEQADLRLVIHGHSDTDEVKAGQGNPLIKYMAQKRVNAVLKYMEEKGVAKTRFETKIHDDMDPADGTGSSTGHAKNRRVEFTIVE